MNPDRRVLCPAAFSSDTNRVARTEGPHSERDTSGNPARATVRHHWAVAHMLQQPSASSGLRIDAQAGLAEVVDLVDPCDRWDLRWINQVWWEGKDSTWIDRSWDEGPLALDDETLRRQAAGAEQVINGRVTGFRGGEEVVMIEAVDSSFWLVWSDDEDLRKRITDRFSQVSNVLPPTEFHPYG